MAKTSGELEKEFIDTAKEKTGRTLEQWLQLVASSGISGRNNILDWLKKGHGINHLQAQFITGMHLNSGQPVYINEDNLLENQFAKCPAMRPLFDALSEKMINTFPRTQLIPKKTYLSFTATREFAAMNIKPSEIRMGLDLGDMPFSDTIQKSKLTGPMPRISHMLIFTGTDQMNTSVIDLIRQSYQRTNK
jgi:predicted transport protein